MEKLENFTELAPNELLEIQGGSITDDVLYGIGFISDSLRLTSKVSSTLLRPL